MTVSATNNLASYSTDGATTNFAVTFEFFGAEGLRVYVVDGSGNATLKTLGTDYTVSGGSASSGAPAEGTVMFVTAPASGQTVNIYRWYSPTQLVDLQNTGRLDVEVLERALDFVTVLVQQVMSRTGGADFVLGATEILLQNIAGTAWDAKSLRITGVADATAASDAASKSYVDAVVLEAGNLAAPAVGQVGYGLMVKLDALALTGASWEIRQLTASDLTGLGTAAVLDSGTDPGDVVIVGGGGFISTALIDTGTTDGKILMADSNDELPPAALPVASGAQMAAATVSNRAATPANLVSSPFTCVARGTIDQSGAQSIAGDVNVASIADPGTAGQTTVNLDVTMADTDYQVLVTGPDNTFGGVSNKTTTGFRINMRTSGVGPADSTGVQFAVFGELA